jgi:hypothetical protein
MQVVVHLLVLAGAALFLPVQVSGMLGAPSVDAPVWWLLGVLFFSIGAPFATLSATAPLLQAWYAKALRGYPEADNPYILYAASNLGSILALLAYPIGVEPFLALPEQGLAWGCIYSAFCLVVAIAAIHVWRVRDNEDLLADAAAAETGSAISWQTRMLWVLLAAGPSSLMLGVTTYISNDVASAPLFWVIPLALYLLTFVIAFQSRPILDSDRALLWQAACVVSAAGLLCLDATSLLAHLMVCLGALFFTALVCHQRLAASRPDPKHLTEFYLFISLGGVFGGMFNALLAPELFSSVLEYPLVLVLCCLARPWNGAALGRRAILIASVGVAAALAIAFVPTGKSFALLALVFVVVSASAAALLSGRALLFTLVIGVLCTQAILVPPDRRANLLTARSFFGVHRVTLESEPALGGTLHLLFHGTTIHGAQPQAAEFRCTPTAYYTRSGPIGQTFEAVLRAHPEANMGVVGLGSGGLATFTLPGSRMRYFEIDPEVERIARDPRYFSYLSECAKGHVDVMLGDARVTVAREPAHSYDLIEVDAFSADNIPTHLLTTQAMQIYFQALKPDGILMLHLTNRNLRLEPPATDERLGPQHHASDEEHDDRGPQRLDA